MNELLFDQTPTISDRAIRFTNDCSTISEISILEKKFPSNYHARWLAKHLYLNTRNSFGNTEGSSDDMIFVIFDALGFNDEDLIIVSRNRLDFKMSNKIVSADADLTVFNLKDYIRLVLVEDKRYDPILSMDEAGEPQLIAEAVAAAMYNRNIFNENRRRTRSEPPVSGSTVKIIDMMNSSHITNMMFMVRVVGSYVFFYSHRFSDVLLDCIADGIVPVDNSQIHKYARIIGDDIHYDLSLLDADDRVIIFQILDSIQQIISKM